MIHTWMILKLEQPEKMLSEQRKRRVKALKCWLLTTELGKNDSFDIATTDFDAVGRMLDDNYV